MASPTADATDRRTFVLLFGGRSAEHDVSCVSARHVLAAIDAGRYDVVPVGIDTDGRWSLAEAAAGTGDDHDTVVESEPVEGAFGIGHGRRA